MGEDCGATRPPSAWPLTAAARAELQRLLGEWKLLPAGRAAA